MKIKYHDQDATVCNITFLREEFPDYENISNLMYELMQLEIDFAYDHGDGGMITAKNLWGTDYEELAAALRRNGYTGPSIWEARP